MKIHEQYIYMKMHKIMTYHGIEKEEINNMSSDLFNTKSVSQICETYQIYQMETHGTYSLILNSSTQNVLSLIDWIVKNRVKNNV